MDLVLLTSSPTVRADVLAALDRPVRVFLDTAAATEYLAAAEPAVVLVHGTGAELHKRIDAIRAAAFGTLHGLIGLLDREQLEAPDSLLERSDALDDVVALPVDPAWLRLRIARRYRTEGALIAREAMYRHFFEISPDLVGIIGLDGHARHVNRPWEALLGCSAEELRDRPLIEWVHPEDVAMFRDALAQLAAEGGRLQRTVRVRRVDGEYRSMDGTAIASPDRPVIYVFARDVTELREAEKRAHERQRIVDNVLEHIPHSVFWKDRDSVYLGCNANFARQAGLSDPQDIIGKTDYELGWAEQADLYRAGDRKVMEGGIDLLNFEEPQSRRDGTVVTLLTSKVPLRNDAGELLGILGIYADISDRKAAEARLHLLSAALEATSYPIVITDASGIISWVNPAFTVLTGYSREEVIGANPKVLKSGEHSPEFYRDLWATIRRGEIWRSEFVNRRKDGTLYTEEGTITPVRDEAGQISHFVAVKQDITEKKLLQSQLAQAQKLEAIGQLAAGIAHEVNTPTQFIGDNTNFLQTAFGDLIRCLERIEEIAGAGEGGDPIPAAGEIRAALKEADVEYLQEEIPRAITQTLEGIDRVGTIVRAMKEFSHPATEKVATDLNHAIETTSIVARNEWKYVAELELDLDPSMPQVECVPGEINQAIVNMIVNAAHAIADAVGTSGAKGRITVSTRSLPGEIEIQVRDTGTGMKPEVRDRVFDPFFTTKAVGRGTGQGLTITHDVVVRRHGGTIRVESELGQGTTFILRLPVSGVGTEQLASG
ncbi:MAG: PAS domain S-box protein [bacterium]